MNTSVSHNDYPLNVLHIVNDRFILAGGVGATALEMLKEQRKLGNNAAIWSIDMTTKIIRSFHRTFQSGNLISLYLERLALNCLDFQSHYGKRLPLMR